MFGVHHLVWISMKYQKSKAYNKQKINISKTDNNKVFNFAESFVDN